MGSIGNVVIPGNRQTKELTLTTALTAGRDHHQLCSPVFRSIFEYSQYLEKSSLMGGLVISVFIALFFFSFS